MKKIDYKELKRIIDEEIEKICANGKSSYFPYEGVITEGLIYSYAPGKISDIVKRRYDLGKIGCYIHTLPKTGDFVKGLKDFANKEYNTSKDYQSLVNFEFHFPKGMKHEDLNIYLDIEKLFTACGWYLCGVMCGINVEKCVSDETIEKFKGKPAKMYFAPKFDVEVNKVPDSLYHIAPLKALDKIMEKGLKPYANGRVENHPERVYLFLHRPEHWTDIASNFRQTGDNGRYALLRVNTLKIRNEITFHQDQNVMTDKPAVYTYEPIPPFAIEIEEKE